MPIQERSERLRDRFWVAFFFLELAFGLYLLYEGGLRWP